MKNELEFKTLEELYKRILPALTAKVSELRAQGLKFPIEKDIWNYLVNKTWKNKTNLELHDLVSDILYLDSHDLNEYVLRKIDRMRSAERDISVL